MLKFQFYLPNFKQTNEFYMFIYLLFFKNCVWFFKKPKSKIYIQKAYFHYRDSGKNLFINNITLNTFIPFSLPYSHLSVFYLWISFILTNQTSFFKYKLNNSVIMFLTPIFLFFLTMFYSLFIKTFSVFILKTSRIYIFDKVLLLLLVFTPKITFITLLLSLKTSLFFTSLLTVFFFLLTEIAESIVHWFFLELFSISIFFLLLFSLPKQKTLVIIRSIFINTFISLVFLYAFILLFSYNLSNYSVFLVLLFIKFGFFTGSFLQMHIYKLLKNNLNYYYMLTFILTPFWFLVFILKIETSYSILLILLHFY